MQLASNGQPDRAGGYTSVSMSPLVEKQEYQEHSEALTQPRKNNRPWLLYTAVALASVSLLFSIIALARAETARKREARSPDSPSQQPLVSRIAFGSCTSYDKRPQPIWTDVSLPVHCYFFMSCISLSSYHMGCMQAKPLHEPMPGGTKTVVEVPFQV